MSRCTSFFSSVFSRHASLFREAQQKGLARDVEFLIIAAAVDMGIYRDRTMKTDQELHDCLQCCSFWLFPTRTAVVLADQI
jgi:hypothetical protein